MAEHLAEPDVCGEAVKQKSQVNLRPFLNITGWKEGAHPLCMALQLH